MVILVASKAEREIAAQQMATRSGVELVPAVVRNAGTQAVESYLCFFATKNHSSAAVYRSTARHFFRWCGETGVALDAIRAGHIDAYLRVKQGDWKPLTIVSAFQSLKKLFNHLESDRIIERTPFIGLEAPKPSKPQLPRATLAELKEMVRELDGYEDGSENFNAGLVVLYPIAVGDMDVHAISRFTNIPLAEVETYARRLKENGIWLPNGRISVTADDMSGPEGIVEIIMQIGAAVGLFARVSIAPGDEV